MSQAALHYKRLEEEQAARLATSTKTGVAHEPRWFKRVRGGNDIGEEYLFRYRGGYWEARTAGDFAATTDALPDSTPGYLQEM